MVEIERKFLLKEMPAIPNMTRKTIEQYYVSHCPEVRLRKETEQIHAEYYLTVKGKGSLVRTEDTMKVTEDIYESLKPMKTGQVISKIRYFKSIGSVEQNSVPLNYLEREFYNTLCPELVAEIDIYTNQLYGLGIIEVEFPSELVANSFVPPDWFGKEVTYTAYFKNSNLSNVDRWEDV